MLGDMVGALQKGRLIEALNDFEAHYNQGLGYRFPVVSLCQSCLTGYWLMPIEQQSKLTNNRLVIN